MGDRSHAGGHRGRGSTAGAAGRVISGPGVQRTPMQRIVGCPAPGERRGVRAPEQYRAGLAKVFHHGAVLPGDVVSHRHKSVGGGQPDLVDVDFCGDRNAMKRAQGQALGDRCISGVGGDQCRFGQHLDNRIQFRVDLLDTFEHRIQGLSARDLPGGNAARQTRGRPAPEFSHEVPLQSLLNLVKRHRASDRCLPLAGDALARRPACPALRCPRRYRGAC